MARYCGLELKEDGSPNNLLLARASIWAPSGSQDAIDRRLLLTHNIEPDLSDLIQTVREKKKNRRHESLNLFHTEKHKQNSNEQIQQGNKFSPGPDTDLKERETNFLPGTNLKERAAKGEKIWGRNSTTTRLHRAGGRRPAAGGWG